MHAEGSGEHLLTAGTILSSTKKVQKKTNKEIKFFYGKSMNANFILTPGSVFKARKSSRWEQSSLQQQESIYFSVGNYIDRIISIG